MNDDKLKEAENVSRETVTESETTEEVEQGDN